MKSDFLHDLFNFVANKSKSPRAARAAERVMHQQVSREFVEIDQVRAAQGPPGAVRKAEPDEKADAQQAKYLFFSDEDQSQVLATAIDEDILLEVLRNFLKKPETPKAQELFKINKEMILKATVSAEGDTKEALTMMQRLFEKEIAKGELK